MYRLNISFAVEPRVADLWTAAVRDGFVPYLRGNGVERVALSRVLHDRAERHFTFSLLMELDDMAAYHRFSSELWGEYLRLTAAVERRDAPWFMSLMKEIE